MEQATTEIFSACTGNQIQTALMFTRQKIHFQEKSIYLFYFRPTTSDQECLQLLKPVVRAWIYQETLGNLHACCLTVDRFGKY